MPVRSSYCDVTAPRASPQEDGATTGTLTRIRINRNPTRPRSLRQNIGDLANLRGRKAERDPRYSELAQSVGDPDDYCFRLEGLSRFPYTLALVVIKRYGEIYKSNGRRAANLAFLDICTDLTSSEISIAYSDQEVADLSQQQAKKSLILNRFLNRPATLIHEVHNIAHSIGVNLGGRLRKLSIAHILVRVCDPLWWRRLIRIQLGRAVERAFIRLGLVHIRAGLYASKECVKRRREQRRRWKSALEPLVAVNELGEEFRLQDLIDRSTSNPTLRRNEWMVRCAGFEAYAKLKSHIGVFLTFTCPGRMHPRLYPKGDPNPNYDDTSPLQAQKHLNNLWARIRSALSREGIRPYGIRVAEPHHDATPHWHLLLFVAPEGMQRLIEICRHYLLLTDPNEPGAAKHRIQVVAIDPRKGTATGYIAKYISKNIDCTESGGSTSSESYNRSERVEAWKAQWGIRQFQQIGGPPVSIWRELRRLRNHDLHGIEPLTAAIEAADNGKWDQFLLAMGGTDTPRKNLPIKLHKVWSDKPGRYGFPIGPQTAGVSSGALIVTSRIHSWNIMRNTNLNLQNPLDHGEAGCGTRSEAGPAGAQPGGACLPSPRPAGVPVSSGFGSDSPLEYCQ